MNTFEIKDETYNGWTNKPTWLVKLWLDNEQTTYNQVIELVKNNKDKEDYQIGDIISNYVDENMLIPLEASLQNDLLGWVMCCVNWSEIAESYKDEL